MESRKRRRGWWAAVGAWLLSSLAAGCRLPREMQTPWVPPPQAAEAAPPTQPAVPAHTAESRAPDYPRVPSTPSASLTTTTRAGAATGTPVANANAVKPRTPGPTPISLPRRTTKPDAARVEVDLEPKHPNPRVTIRPIPVGPTTAGAHEETSEAAFKLPEPPLVAALRCYLEKRPDDALRHLKRFDTVNQELLICLLPLAVQLAEAGQPGERQNAMVVETLESVMYGMRTRAPLAVEKMCLCQNIKGFGVYEPMAEDHVFRPGEQLRVYAELRNFSTERQEANGGPAVYVTRIASRAEIRDPAGKTVWKQQLQRDEPDRSQTPRHDYFDHYCFFLPELRAGRYKLEIMVEDLATHRKARCAVDLKVGLLPQGS